MTRVYEIPYLPESGFRWAVRMDGAVVEYFSSRFEALRAAVNRAAADGGDASIRVEGADGVWRPFGSDAKRPFETSEYAEQRRMLSLVR
ncbi:DUF2188 domain-containing protein [Luteibacter aegosomatis]|jgi:hypothetical protein|uniref:DUF2188 domain-containing protein n=1 Tax=Luteibacter aegosomatis TaxID=2911537 RepID=UPI001FF9D072|nr:DUF2188 domain-containing protein [Luteibacter aegosomatis]UPG87097.1 DUF2188 domain-containing protein [Luteibacter aegosomatis]